MTDRNRSAHTMPFGAEMLAEGGVRFRLWAPSLSQVMLRIEGQSSREPAEFPMLRSDDGWHTRNLGTADAGDRYSFLLPDGLQVPDPASRFNPDDAHAASAVVDPLAFEWPEDGWIGRRWEDAVIYELHVGTFSPGGDFAGVEARLDYLAELGVTALEIMPIADFPGQRNWGYDGVLPYAPDASYGKPEDFKRLIAAAHARGLMVFLDVVYNHFGPDGNYLHCYCPEFFNPHHHTPWGAAINFDGAHNRTVRDFFVHNVLYWLEEYRLDGLRLDAIHAICDDSTPDIVEEIRDAVQALAAEQQRHIHLILENDKNQAHYLKSRPRQDGASNEVAQWNDDIHHALHVIATGETDGYYADYATDPHAQLMRCLASGFAFQGEPSPFRGGANRGEPSGHLPPAAFIDFLQTHDQIGNRALGERLSHLAPHDALHAVTAVLLLAPQPPMLFMGEEFAAATPFLYFCDFSDNPDLARAVTEGRRREFAEFAQFANPATRERIPDPNATTTYEASKLDWQSIDRSPHAAMLAIHRSLLALRQREIMPRLAGMTGNAAMTTRFDVAAFRVAWRLGDGSILTLTANLGPGKVGWTIEPHGRLLFATPNAAGASDESSCLAPWSVCWHLKEGATQ